MRHQYRDQDRLLFALPMKFYSLMMRNDGCPGNGSELPNTDLNFPLRIQHTSEHYRQ